MKHFSTLFFALLILSTAACKRTSKTASNQGYGDIKITLSNFPEKANPGPTTDDYSRYLFIILEPVKPRTNQSHELKQDAIKSARFDKVQAGIYDLRIELRDDDIPENSVLVSEDSRVEVKADKTLELQFDIENPPEN